MSNQIAKSESIMKLAEALSKAQGEFGPVKKDCTNPFYKSKYADLASILEAVRPSLAKHELSHVQIAGTNEHGDAVVTTLLLHASGEFISAELSLPVAKADAQGFGSALTYARRYGLQAILGVAAEDDDDGNAAVDGDGSHKTARPANGKHPSETINCEKCKLPITAFAKVKDGIKAVVPAAQIVASSKLNFDNHLYCGSCQIELTKSKKAAPAINATDAGEVLTIIPSEVKKVGDKFQVTYDTKSGDRDKVGCWSSTMAKLLQEGIDELCEVKIKVTQKGATTYRDIVDVLKVKDMLVEDGQLVVRNDPEAELGITDRDIA